MGEREEGILIEGEVATAVEWLSGGVDYRVLGPSETFGRKAALEIAAEVAAANGGDAAS
ncbi:hypothetical protein HRbin12_01785 [bacterium HR12]|nr:hypothetical protein HRbin12_01785 [bacterium HR12]